MNDSWTWVMGRGFTVGGVRVEGEQKGKKKLGQLLWIKQFFKKKEIHVENLVDILVMTRASR